MVFTTIVGLLWGAAACHDAPTAPQLSPARIAYVTGNGQIRVVDAVGSADSLVASSGNYIAEHVWSHGRVAYISGTGLWILDRQTGTQYPVDSAFAQRVRSVDWSPDGSRLVFVDDSNQVRIVDATGKYLSTLPIRSYYQQDGLWSPDGKSLAIAAPATNMNTFAIWVAPVDGSPARQLDTVPGMRPRWSPDGRWIAFENTGAVFVVPARGGNGTSRKVVATACWPTCSVGDTIFYRPRWSADGSMLAGIIPGGSNGLLTIWVALADGSQHWKYPTGGGAESPPEWSPDANTLTFVGSGAFNYEIVTMNADGSGLRAVTQGGSSVSPRWVR